jgi:hypothetical protein
MEGLAGAALGAGVGAVMALAARALFRRRHAVATA